MYYLFGSEINSEGKIDGERLLEENSESNLTFSLT
jgi:hypothetical protein